MKLIVTKVHRDTWPDTLNVEAKQVIGHATIHLYITYRFTEGLKPKVTVGDELDVEIGQVIEAAYLVPALEDKTEKPAETESVPTQSASSVAP